jgi:hypothetical protein
MLHLQPMLGSPRVIYSEMIWIISFGYFVQVEDESIARGIEAPPEYASEILEEFTTHRGELKHRAPSFHDERLIRVLTWPLCIAVIKLHNIIHAENEPFALCFGSWCQSRWQDSSPGSLLSLLHGPKLRMEMWRSLDDGCKIRGVSWLVHSGARNKFPIYSK